MKKYLVNLREALKRVGVSFSVLFFGISIFEGSPLSMLFAFYILFVSVFSALIETYITEEKK